MSASSSRALGVIRVSVPLVALAIASLCVPGMMVEETLAKLPPPVQWVPPVIGGGDELPNCNQPNEPEIEAQARAVGEELAATRTTRCMPPGPASTRMLAGNTPIKLYWWAFLRSCLWR